MKTYRIVSLSHDLTIGDVHANARSIVAGITKYVDADVILTPAMGLVGATIGDLVRQDLLLREVEVALGEVAQATQSSSAVVIVGFPLRRDKLYQCAALLAAGKIVGIAAKQTLTAEEKRNFAPAPTRATQVTVAGQPILLGGTQVFAHPHLPEVQIGVQFGDEIYDAKQVRALVRQGADLIVDLSATPTLPLAFETTLRHAQHVSGKYGIAYALANALGESTTDCVYGGEKLVVSGGKLLAEAHPFGCAAIVADAPLRVTDAVRVAPPKQATLPEVGKADPYPFIPHSPATCKQLVRETLEIQAQGLATRMRRIGNPRLVLGVSGGLDSTLALLVCHRACAILGLSPREQIIAVTLPCFGTTDHTKNNAKALMSALGLNGREINVGASVRQHLADIGHDGVTPDVTFENAQARMRTMVLMDLANLKNGLVIGTGDLSELALGWCTYNGDHMAMYGVNGSIPKTLIRVIVGTVAKESPAALKRVLLDILDTPISPELLPNVDGQIAQKTEELVGKYDVNDFILYYVIRWNLPPKDVFAYAAGAFPTVDKGYLKECFARFYRRFFSQQFKRSCSPDGVKAGPIDLSPRGEWQMPSDATAALWLKEIESL